MAGLLDFLQSASNTAASNVSAPVDGLAWLLRKTGLDVGEPVGGSDWMQRQGLTRPVAQSGASLAGETMGLLAPIGVAAKAPQIARGLLRGADNLVAPTQLSRQAGAIKVSMKPDSSWLSAQSENGLVGGHVKDGALHISYADLAENARGKGEGLQLYKNLIDDALSKGLKVYSDSTVELPAVRVYEALSKRGYGVNKLGGGILEDGSAYGAGANSPAFEVSRLSK